MFQTISLRQRLLLLITALALLNLFGSLGTVWYTYRVQSIYADMLDRDVKSLTAAQKMETELVMQKGLATYYLLTRDDKWLEQLGGRHNNFKSWLSRARAANNIEAATEILNEIESRYIRYVFERDQVVALYKDGKREEGENRHWRVREQFFAVFDLAEKFKAAHENQIEDLRNQFRKSNSKMVIFAWAAIPCVLLISILLTLVLLRQILTPIRELAMENGEWRKPMGDEVKAVKNRLDHLVENIGQTRAKLVESQTHLIQSEKLAMVGKLAAGVAHSVRNPLTSVKMRLFTLERSLRLTPTQKEDLDVISEEIRHIDTILRNFLEYSRPPKLKMHPASPSDVVDMTLQLLRHRFDSYRTEVQVKRIGRLPEISIDTDQLKEVLVNLLVNACEAMGEGGMIQIVEETGLRENLGAVALIQIHDNGPGIPETLQEKVFQPFFSSKEEGSGLGLSIAKRIIEEHGGEIDVRPGEGAGATFVIALPMKEAIHG
ncbi:MAG: sensor histidine kinase [Thermodesulfobacteriota bacterium]